MPDPTAYYNERDPFAAEWLRNLIAAGHITPGVVDDRDIRDVRPEDVANFERVHLFAGIGVWDYALRLAGWPEGERIWTGSCPCQPFSTAGKRKGTDDERHLWPEMFRLVRACRPPVVLGEQVASKDGLAWLDTVSADLEGADYDFGAADLCAAGVGAPHIRQRLWFVGRLGLAGSVTEQQLARGISEEKEAQRGRVDNRHWPASEAGWLGDPSQPGLEGRPRVLESLDLLAAGADGLARSGATNGHWASVDWILCRDPGGPRWRPVAPGTFPLANGAPSRVGRLRAYGNAIVAPLAAEFIRAVMGCRPR